MAVSVRMDPLMEKELELAARRQGITKSQFIINAVERALGRKDPAALFHKVMDDSARYRVGDELPDEALSPIKAALRQTLRARHAKEQDDYAAYLSERQSQVAGGPD